MELILGEGISVSVYICGEYYLSVCARDRRELMTLFRAASNSINDRDVAFEQLDCHDHVSVIPALPLVDGTQYDEDAVDAGSTTVSTFLAQGTNTVSLALEGRSDMVSVILANINSLVSHPTTSANSARDATGMLAIAMANAKPSASRTAALSVTTSSLESLAAFELFKKSGMQEYHAHSDDCDCASCVASPAALSPLTAAPHFPTLHPLMPRAYMATVTVTVTCVSPYLVLIMPNVSQVMLSFVRRGTIIKLDGTRR
jgi:hypothetical protein